MSLQSQTDAALDSAPWEEVAPLLDDALAHLGRKDRDAVLLKYIQGKTHRDVGAALGVSEEAARKRIDRAIDRLREIFRARGNEAAAGRLLLLLAEATCFR